MTENQRRKFLKLVGATLAGAAGVSILGCAPEEQPGKPVSLPSGLSTRRAAVPQPNPIVGGEAPPILTVSRKALAERLKKLAESEPPVNLQYGANCYEMDEPYHEWKPCPNCGVTMEVGEVRV